MVQPNSTVTEVSGSGSVTGTLATSSSPASYVVSAADFSEDSNEELPPIGGEAYCLLHEAHCLLNEAHRLLNEAHCPLNAAAS